MGMGVVEVFMGMRPQQIDVYFIYYLSHPRPRNYIYGDINIFGQ